MSETILEKPVRILQDPTWEGEACVYLTAHAARRLGERFGVESLRQTPFFVFTHYCERDDINRPVWTIPISGKQGPGYILGRWEQSTNAARYKHWFVATTCILDHHFKGDGLKSVKAIKVNVVRVMNQLKYWKTIGFAEK